MHTSTMLSLRALIAAGLLTVAPWCQVSSAAQVDYSGRVFFSGVPVSGGYVIAGTFKPGFNPSTYTCVYGDNFCNLDSGAYDHAVADGNFIPIGTGALTNSSGVFNATGDTTAAQGTPIWLFAFQNNSRNSFFQALASSSNSTWKVPAQPIGTTTISVTTANMFIMGATHPQGIQLSVVPFPEPTSAMLMAAGAVALAVVARRRPN